MKCKNLFLRKMSIQIAKMKSCVVSGPPDSLLDETKPEWHDRARNALLVLFHVGASLFLCHQNRLQ